MLDRLVDEPGEYQPAAAAPAGGTAGLKSLVAGTLLAAHFGRILLVGTGLVALAVDTLPWPSRDRKGPSAHVSSRQVA